MNGTFLPLGVEEITLTVNSRHGLARDWHTNVQPVIKKDVTRPDAYWNWPYQIAPLILFGHKHRDGRLFQVTVGAQRRPAAMIALLARERWCLDPNEPATFVFYLSAAPSGLLTTHDTAGNGLQPKMIGQAALDVACCVALNATAGRFWLHADPKGGPGLLSWYQQRGMRIVDVKAYPILPGFTTGRNNDGRYLFMDGNDAQQAYNMHQPLR